MRCLATPPPPAAFLLAVFLSLAASARAQITEPPPDELLDAGHCLATAHPDWLGLNQNFSSQLDLGFVTDTKAYPGHQLLDLVEYTTPTHTRGMVFTFLFQTERTGSSFLKHKSDPHRTLRLEFHTAFHQSDDGSRQIELIDPQFGGIATQDQVVSAIREVGFHTYSVPVADLRNRPTSAQCEFEPDTE